MTMLNEGQSAPDFTLPTHEGTQVSLAGLREQAERGVVVYFYPKAATPGCTQEACDFRDNLATLAGLGYLVVGVSTDPTDELRDFAEDQQLTFPLASDIDHLTAQAYGTWGLRTIGDRQFYGVRRSTFVVGKDGAVLRAEYDVNASGHVAALRDELAR